MPIYARYALHEITSGEITSHTPRPVIFLTKVCSYHGDHGSHEAGLDDVPEKQGCVRTRVL